MRMRAHARKHHTSHVTPVPWLRFCGHGVGISAGYQAQAIRCCCVWYGESSVFILFKSFAFSHLGVLGFLLFSWCLVNFSRMCLEMSFNFPWGIFQPWNQETHLSFVSEGSGMLQVVSSPCTDACVLSCIRDSLMLNDSESPLLLRLFLCLLHSSS